MDDAAIAPPDRFSRNIDWPMIARTGLVVLLVLAMFNAHPSPGFACSCMAQTNQGYAGRAMLVFTGVVTEVTRHGNPMIFSSMDPVEVRFAVEKVYKGDVAANTIIWTAASDASCGYGFERGTRYTVFTYESEGRQRSGSCSGNVQGEIVSAMYGLSVGRPPSGTSTGSSPQSPGEDRTVALLGVLGVLAAAGALVLASRLRTPLSR